jgi:hypothetical protein
MPLQIRRGNTAQRLAITPLPGELIYDTVEKKIYVGDGATAGGVWITGVTAEDAGDIAAALFTGGTHSGITFTYNDAAGTIDANVTFGATGPFDGDISGSVYADDSTLLVDGTDGGAIRGDVQNENIEFGTSLSTPLGAQAVAILDLQELLIESNVANTFQVSTFGGYNSANAQQIFQVRSRGTIAAPTVNQPFDLLGGINWMGYDGADYLTAANIVAVLDDQTPTSNIMPARILLRIRDNGTLTTAIEVANDRTTRLAALGNLIVGQPLPVLETLDGDLKGSVFADDSSVMVDGVSGKIVGDIDNNNIQFSGNLTSNPDGSPVSVQLTSSFFELNSDQALGNSGFFQLSYSNSSANANDINVLRSRGTQSFPLVVQDGDEILKIVGYGHDGSAYVPAADLSVGLFDSEPIGSGAIPGGFRFRVRTSGSLTDAVKIANDRSLKVDRITSLNNGEVEVDIQGSVFADNSTLLVDGIEGKLVGPIRSNDIVATANLNFEFGGSVDGSLSADASNFYVSAFNGTDLFLNSAAGNIILTCTGTIQAQALLTTTAGFSGNLTGNVTGNLAGNSVGYHTGDMTGSVFGDNSTLLIDGLTSQVVGPIRSSNIVGTGTLNMESGTAVFGSISADPTTFYVTAFGGGNLSLDSTFGDVELRANSGVIRAFSTVVATVQGTVIADDSTVIIDGANGGAVSAPSVTAANFLQLPVIADDTARSAAIPVAAKGMLILMESGTAPAATNQLQFFDGSNWINV